MSSLSNSAAAIRDYDNRHYQHPWQAMWLTDGADRTISARAENIYVYTPDGKRLIDGPGGMWCTQIGYGRRDMADAIAEQVMRLSYHSPWNTASEPSALLAKKLADLAPGDLNTVFFTTGGSTAVDTALRFVHFYNNRLGRPAKKVVISREKAYHGSTYLAASVTGKERSKSWFDVDAEGTHLLPDVNPSTRPDGTSLEAWCDAKVADLEAAIAEIGPDQGRRVHRRAGARLGWSHPPAAGLPPALPGGMSRPRRALHLRRGRHRIRPARPLVRLRGRVRRPAGPDHLRQGAHFRLPAAGGVPDLGPRAGAGGGRGAGGCPVLQRLPPTPAIPSPARRRSRTSRSSRTKGSSTTSGRYRRTS